jgi:hypothetical protein
MEMKDILDIDLDMENQSLTEYIENFRRDSFEHYSPDQQGEMIIDKSNEFKASNTVI